MDFLEDVVDDATGENQQTVTLMMDDISLGEALKSLCKAANLVPQFINNPAIRHRSAALNRFKGFSMYVCTPKNLQINSASTLRQRIAGGFTNWGTSIQG